MIQKTILALGCLSLPVHTRADDLASTVVSGNKASVEMIDSYYADVELETTSKKGKSTKTGRYWRDKAGVRISEQTASDRVTDVSYRAGKVRVIITTAEQRDSHTTGMIVGDRNRRAVETDAWEASLFSLPVNIYRAPPYPIYSLSDAVRKGQVRQAEWVKDGPGRVAHLVIDLPGGDRTYEVWVDPAHNWLVSRCVHVVRVDGEEHWKNEYRVTEFAEAKPSVFVPTRTRISIQYKGDLVHETVATLRGVRVNEPLPSAPVMPLSPAGTLVLDEVAGTSYRLDGAGRVVGRVRRVGESYSPPMPAPDPLGGGRITSILGWVAIATAVVLAVAAGVLVRRRSSRRLRAAG